MGMKAADGNREEEAPENTFVTGTQECRLDRRGGKGVKMWLEQVLSKVRQGEMAAGVSRTL